jgi:antitoxin Phd
MIFEDSMSKSPSKPNHRAGSIPTGRLKAAGETWQVQSAKARFSEVFRKARTEGPQRITRQGKESVVMVAEEQYDRLVGKSHQPKNLVQFFRQSPLAGVDLDLERDRDPGRNTDLT